MDLPSARSLHNAILPRGGGKIHGRHEPHVSGPSALLGSFKSISRLGGVSSLASRSRTSLATSLSRADVSRRRLNPSSAALRVEIDYIKAWVSEDCSGSTEQLADDLGCCKPNPLDC